MAKVLRCPACGALWRVKDDFAADMLHCTECQACFSADKTESLSVPDEKLDARLAQAAKRQAVLQKEAREGEAVMSRIADSLTDFDARDSVREPSATQASSQVPEVQAPSERSHGALWTVIALLAVVVLCAAALLLGHKTVLGAMPQLRPVYEKVCRTAPCPGFVWQDASAFEVTSEIERPLETADDADREVARRLPVVVARIANTSDLPQALPILEMKLLDAAGETLAQRVLEPADYGYGGRDAIAPGAGVSVRLTVTTPLPYDAASALVKPVSALP